MQISVTFRVELPDLAGLGHESIQNWLEFQLGAVCSLMPSPISDQDLEALRHSVSFSRVD